MTSERRKKSKKLIFPLDKKQRGIIFSITIGEVPVRALDYTITG
jgi:hypothetical protein